MNKNEIVNLALNSIGSSRVANVDDPQREESRVMKLLWEPVLKEVLSEYPWRSARKRKQALAPLPTNESKWEYAYELPTDCVFVHDLLEDETFRELRDVPSSAVSVDSENDYFLQEGSTLYTNYNPCHILYIAIPTDVGTLDAPIAHFMSWRLAYYASQRLGKQGQVVNRAMSQMERALAKAKALDGLGSVGRPKRKLFWDETR